MTRAGIMLDMPGKWSFAAPLMRAAQTFTAFD